MQVIAGTVMWIQVGFPNGIPNKRLLTCLVRLYKAKKLKNRISFSAAWFLGKNLVANTKT